MPMLYTIACLEYRWLVSWIAQVIKNKKIAYDGLISENSKKLDNEETYLMYLYNASTYELRRFSSVCCVVPEEMWCLEL